ncbi:MAG: SRPBCC domain-containing protein [Planctomycetota bacterium]|nr:SRPBCC domain-containing protein [Planctomycetota bacterium]
MIEKVFSIDIKAGAQRVWDEITRSGSPHHAMFGTYLHGPIAPGAVLSYRNKRGTHTFVLGEVLEVDAPRRLVHTFRFSMEQDAPTLVEWRLTEQGGVTRVTITHSRFEGETRTLKSVTTSWPAILALYKAVIETGRAPAGARFKNALMMSMSFMLPKSARTEVALAASTAVPGVERAGQSVR